MSKRPGLDTWLEELRTELRGLTANGEPTLMRHVLAVDQLRRRIAFLEAADANAEMEEALNCLFSASAKLDLALAKANRGGT